MSEKWDRWSREPCDTLRPGVPPPLPLVKVNVLNTRLDDANVIDSPAASLAAAANRSSKAASDFSTIS